MGRAELGRRFGRGLKGKARRRKIQSAARAMSRFAVAFPGTYRSMTRRGK